MGIMDKMKEIAAEGQRQLDAKKAQEQAKEKELARIIVSTGDLRAEYEVLDAIFAMDSHAAGIWSSANPAEAFSGVKKKLRQTCLEIGGNGIINCQFEYRVALSSGGQQCMEIFAYGTAVRFNKDGHTDISKNAGTNASKAGSSDALPQQPSSIVTSPEISFACTKCAQSLKVDSSCAGQIANCPKCNAEIQIPAK